MYQITAVTLCNTGDAITIRYQAASRHSAETQAHNLAKDGFLVSICKP